MWVEQWSYGPADTGAAVDYLYVYQGASVAVTTSAQLLSNDNDPQGQPLTVVSVSEPGNDGVLTGDLATGFTYTPSNDPALINTDHTLDYLVTDTDGHVAQSNIIIRILANGDPNQPPVAVPDIGRTDDGDSQSTSFTDGNDFDPDGDAFSVVNSRHPRPRNRLSGFGNGVQLHTQPRLLRHRDHHLPPPRHPRPHRQRPRHRHRQHHPATTPIAVSTSYRVQAG